MRYRMLISVSENSRGKLHGKLLFSIGGTDRVRLKNDQ